MKGRKIVTMLFLILITGWFSGFTPASAQIITSVVRGGISTNTPPQIASTPLVEDSLCFVDRTHQYNSIPTYLLGAEYVKVANEDKTQLDYQLNVTLSQPARLYLLLDNRLGHGSTAGGEPNLNPDLWSADMWWVYEPNGPGVFVDTGLNIGIDEEGDGDVDQWASIYVKNFPAGTVTLLWQNDKTEPVSRNLYGVAALKQQVFKSFWSKNKKLNLVETPDWIAVGSGYYGGWEWFNDGSNWHGPYDGKSGTDGKWPPDDFWDPCAGQSSDDSTWGGDPHFWAFTDRMTLRYNHKKMRPLDQQFFFWTTGSQGYCIVMLAEYGGSCGPQRPLDPEIIANLQVQSRSYSVNADKVVGEFSAIEWVPINMLEISGRELGMTEADLQTFMAGDMITNLRISDPAGHGVVGIQHTGWPIPEPSIVLPEHLEITEGDTISYGFRLRHDPGEPVVVKVSSSDPAQVSLPDAGTSGEVELHFDQNNWKDPCNVRVRAIPINIPIIKKVMLAHYVAGYPYYEGSVLPVTILDKKTGGEGYLSTDINFDAVTDFKDVAHIAAKWLKSTEQPPQPPANPALWNSRDIGTTGGSVWWTDDELFIEANGGDIWGASDEFHYFYYKMPEDDFQLSVTVNSLEPISVWTKAGIMIRNSLDADSAHAMIVVTPGRGVAFQWRPEKGAESYSIHGGPAGHLDAPVSLRLVMAGDTIRGYYYSGGKWTELVGALPIPLPVPRPEYIGLAVTAHAAPGVMTTASFGTDLVSWCCDDL